MPGRNATFDSRLAPKFVVRMMRDGMAEEVAERAALENRSRNGVWVEAMEHYLTRQRRMCLLLDALEQRCNELGINLEDIL